MGPASCVLVWCFVRAEKVVLIHGDRNCLPSRECGRKGDTLLLLFSHGCSHAVDTFPVPKTSGQGFPIEFVMCWSFLVFSIQRVEDP